MAIRANLWVEVVFEMLADRAMISTEIADMLKSSGRGGRYPPSPRRVTFVLRSDNRFRELGDEIIGTIARNRSHQKNHMKWFVVVENHWTIFGGVMPINGMEHQ